MELKFPGASLEFQRHVRPTFIRRPETGAAASPFDESHCQVSPDGKELFYVDKTVGGKLIAVEIKAANNTIQAASPKPLFDFTYNGALPHSFVYHTYAVSPDGQRFLIPKPVSGSAEETAAPLVVILNWISALNKK